MLSLIVFGVLVGIVARLLLPSQRSTPLFPIAILGSIAGDWLLGRLNLYPVQSRPAYFAALIGSLLLLFLYRAATRRTRSLLTKKGSK